MSVTQYIGARYVPLFAEPAEWSNDRTYEPLTIVLHQGNSYTSRQFVPKGIDITNADFWAETGNYNAQVEQYRQEVLSMDDRMGTVEASAQANATAISNETTRATTAEQANADAISAEVTRATAAEQANATAVAGKAPTDHASADTTYGVGTSTAYGHLKVTDSPYLADAQSALSSLGASQMTAGVINLATYGIKTDEGFDNTSIIQAAVDANPGKLFVLPSGSYGISDTVDFGSDSEIWCIGEFKAIAPFQGSTMLTVNGRVENPNPYAMTSSKTYKINVDCNDQPNLNGVIISNCYRCESFVFVRNCQNTGFTNSMPNVVSGNCENTHNVCVWNDRPYTTSVAVKTAMPDDFFNVNAREVNVVFDNVKGCTFGYVHAWLASDALWSTSTVFRSHGCSAEGFKVYADTMRYVFDGDNISVFMCDQLMINVNTVFVSAETVTASPYAITTGDYVKASIGLYIDFYADVMTSVLYSDPNMTDIRSCYHTMEYRGDVLQAAAGTWWLDGNNQISNGPSDLDGNWAIFRVERGHNYNFLTIQQQNKDFIYKRTTAPDSHWAKITMTQV